jgi:3-oxoadipate enol-lactonase
MKIMIDGNQVNYEMEGPTSAPVVMLSHALATNLSLWDPQIGVLARDFRVLRYDSLGHGGSGAPPGPYSLDQLARQAAGLLDALGIARVHFVGLSMGGMIAQALALIKPQSVASLLLCDTSSRIPPEAQTLWQERIRIAESEGMEPLVEPAVARWFTAPFRAAHPDVIERVRGMMRGTSPSGCAACCHAIAALDLTDRLQAIQAPALVIVGEEDQGTPIAMSRTIHERVAGSEMVILPSAPHLSNVEQPQAFNRAVTTFLGRVAGKA